MKKNLCKAFKYVSPVYILGELHNLAPLTDWSTHHWCLIVSWAHAGCIINFKRNEITEFNGLKISFIIFVRKKISFRLFCILISMRKGIHSPNNVFGNEIFYFEPYSSISRSFTSIAMVHFSKKTSQLSEANTNN